MTFRPVIEIVSRSMIKYLALVLAGIIVFGIVHWRTIPVNALRYMAWRLTSTALSVNGQVRNANADIHYVSYGNGPAVLLLHGGLSNRISWFSQIPQLVDAGWRVILPDTRGHGDSTLGSEELSYRLLADDTVKIIDALGIAQTDVVGWSDGGNTALLLGRYWPERIRRMVVISANARPEGLTPDAQRENTETSSGAARWFTRWWTGAGDRIKDLDARIKKMWRTRPTLKRDDLERITAPTLVIVGETDVVSTAHARQMTRWLGNGSLVILPGGHSTPVTQSRRVNALISEFLGLAGFNETAGSTPDS